MGRPAASAKRSAITYGRGGRSLASGRSTVVTGHLIGP
jgi:hypothetical protein